MMNAAAQMRGTVSATAPWDVMVDLFFYREPEETKDPAEEEAALPAPDAGYGGAACLPAPQGVAADAEWDTAAPPTSFPAEAAAAAGGGGGGGEVDAAPAPAPAAAAGGDWDAAPAPAPAAAPAPAFAAEPAYAPPPAY